MVTVHVDPVFDDADRRSTLYAGDVITYSHLPEIAAFAAFTPELITGALGEAPTAVHERLGPAQLTDLLIDFKPKFTHHPEWIRHVRRITEALGRRPDELHADVPKLRTASQPAA